MKKQVLSMALIIALSTSSLYAINNEIESTLKNAFGGDSNVLTNSTNPKLWKDPSSGVNYYSGGNITLKFKNKGTYTPWISARAPSISAGCSGFSLDAGFASIIDLDGISDQLSAAGTSIVGGFLSSILYSTPILGDILTEVKRIADEITAILQNACNIGKSLGNFANNKMAAAYKDSDIEKAITSVKDTGEETFLTDEILANKEDIYKNLKCMKSADVVGCYGGASSSEGSKGTPDAITITIRKEHPEKNGAGGIVSKNRIKTAKQKSFFVDKMSLQNFLSPSNQSSDDSNFENSEYSRSYGTAISELVMILNPPKIASHSLCQTLLKIIRISDTTATATDKEEGAQMVVAGAVEKVTAVLQSSKYIESTSYLPFFLEVDSTERTPFDSTRDFGEFIMTGKVSNSSVSTINPSLVVVNLVDKPASTPDQVTTQKFTHLCEDDNSPATFNLSWGGFATTAQVEAQMELIATNAPISSLDLTIPITAEAAQLAKILGKKYAIESNGDSVLALTITSQNLAYLNNYILANKILDALYTAQLESDSIIAQDSNTANISRIDPKIFLINMAEELRIKLSTIMGAEPFMESIIRDSKEIETKFELMRVKAGRR